MTNDQLDLPDEYLEQYSRHIVLPEFGKQGQTKLAQAKILLAGGGGLGAPVLTYLASAGVKKLGLFDPDVVKRSDLPRQIVYKPTQLNKPKIDAAYERLRELSPSIEIEIYRLRLKAANVLSAIKDYDVIIDGTDNFAAKYLLNDACVLAKRPLVHAGVLRYTGQIMTIQPGKSACFRCIFPQPPPPEMAPTCQEAGILSTVAGIAGLIQATEAIKLIIGKGDLLTNRILFFDIFRMQFDLVEVRRNPDCPLCGTNPTIRTVEDFPCRELCT